MVGIDNFTLLHELLTNNELKKSDFTTKLIDNNIWKVNPINDTVAKSILDTLKRENLLNNKIQYYTYSNKNLRNLKVICRGLHPSLDDIEITKDLCDQGFKPVKATCLMKKVSTPNDPSKTTGNNHIPMEISDPNNDMDATIVDNDNQPLFLEDKNYSHKFKLVKIPVHQLEFESDENIERIYNIKGILSMLVKIEAIKVKSERVIQCKNCQQYGHSASFCGKQPRCVKCASKHLSQDCPWPKRVINPKCVNCGATGHPANYRGCPVAKEAQLERKNAIASRKTGKPQVNGRFTKNNKQQFPKLNSKQGKQSETTAASRINPNISFADALSGVNQSTDIISQLLSTIESQRKQNEGLTSRLARLESLLVSCGF